MAISSFWYLIIWLAVASVFFSIIGCKYRVKSYGVIEARWRFSAAFLFMLPFMIWAGFRNLSYGDTAAYLRMLNDAPSDLSQLSEYIAKQSKDKGYFALMVLFKSLFGESRYAFFCFIAAIQGIILVFIYRKYSCDYAFSIFLFVSSTDYVSWMHNGIRQFLAATIVFACFPLIMKKKYVPTIAIILLAATIHFTALFFIPFIFIAKGEPWNKKTVVFILSVIIAILFLDRFTNIITIMMENTQYGSEVEDFLNDSGVNIFRVLVYSVPAVVSLLLRKQIKAYHNPMINFCVNMSIVASGIYIIGIFTSGILFGRLPIYFVLYNYILLPWMINTLFVKDSAKIIKVVCMGSYLVFFYYQMHFAWGIL